MQAHILGTAAFGFFGVSDEEFSLFTHTIEQTELGPEAKCSVYIEETYDVGQRALDQVGALLRESGTDAGGMTYAYACEGRPGGGILYMDKKGIVERFTTDEWMEMATDR